MAEALWHGIKYLFFIMEQFIWKLSAGNSAF